jgi:hypothetical protein
MATNEAAQLSEDITRRKDDHKEKKKRFSNK